MTAPLWKKLRNRLPPLSDFVPKTLFGRSMLIFVLPVVIMQIAVVYTFFDRHWQSVSTSLSEGVVGDIAVVLELYQQDTDLDHRDQVTALAIEKMNLSVALQPDEILPTSTHASFNSPLDRTLRRAMSSKISQPFWFDTNRYPAYIDIQVQMEDGVLRFIAPRDKVYATTGNIFVGWLVGATLLLTGVAVVFTRVQLRPIQKLVEVAERLGRGQESPDFQPSGALEIRRASEAFIQMQERISRFVYQRTEMLAGVSHDLRTPLTRLKLQFAMMEDTPELNAAREDLGHMQQMLEGYLDFARGEAQTNPVELDLAQIIPALAAKSIPKDRLAELDIADSLPVMVRAQSIERGLSNLMENAVRYAETVWVSAQISGEQIVISVEDDGPGIPLASREDAFRPFNRLDEARNLNTEGVGLGLAIARDAARTHGGDVQLSNSDHGGLRVDLVLPVYRL
ncbi:MAG: two-component sensor histidine kinase [Robiginitomaculum sp.]|nr:MAG: two-component sensor histidine kinase [Robiginitomaculum sp.]